LHPWPFALAQSSARVQAAKEKKVNEGSAIPHHANIKKQSIFFVKGNLGFPSVPAFGPDARRKVAHTLTLQAVSLII
jgi:hypothetical protein